MFGRLSKRPGFAPEGCHATADGEIDAFDEGGLNRGIEAVVSEQPVEDAARSPEHASDGEGETIALFTFDQLAVEEIVGDGGEGANFWLSVLSDLQSRGVEDILIACVDGLTGFSAAIEAIYPETIVQRCIIHQIRHTLRYVTWSDQKEFMQDLKPVYQAKTREEGETNLLQLAETWVDRYPAAIRSWETNWTELSTFFDFPAQIRRLIYTNNAIEGYHRQLRKVTKNKAVFPTPKSVRKLLYLAQMNIQKKWSMPIPNWAKIRNQLAIRFEGRFPL